MNQIKTGVGVEIYSNSEADKLCTHYDSDVSYELSKMLTKSIDKEIIKSMGIYSRNIRRINSINKIFKSSE
jgi:hypothetical protein